MEKTNISDVKSIQVVYSALMIGPLLFLLVAAFLNQTGGAFIENDLDFMNIMLLISIVLAISAISAGLFVFNSQMKLTGSESDVSKKFQIYRGAMIVRAALFEGAAFFAIVNLLLFGHFIFIVISLACLGIMAMYFPSRNRISKEMKLKVEDIKNY